MCQLGVQKKNSTYFHVLKTVHIYCTTRYDKKGKEKSKETTSNDRRRNTRGYKLIIILNSFGAEIEGQHGNNYTHGYVHISYMYQIPGLRLRLYMDTTSV